MRRPGRRGCTAPAPPSPPRSRGPRRSLPRPPRCGRTRRVKVCGGANIDLGGAAVGRVTLQTIADRVGVSRMTVSNAFPRPDQLSPTLRDRILAVADELGYVGPDPAARAL